MAFLRALALRLADKGLVGQSFAVEQHEERVSEEVPGAAGGARTRGSTTVTAARATDATFVGHRRHGH